jgi:hypothetical protein
MRGLSVVLTLSACAPSFEARGSLAGPVGASPLTGPTGTVGVGIAIETEESSAAEYIEVGRSPLRGEAEALLFGAGVRLDRELRDAWPWLRGYGRLSLGASAEEGSRSIEMISAGAGVTVLHASPAQRASIGLGLVYTYAEDEMTGAADLIGIELDVVLSVGRTAEQKIGDWFEDHDK